MKIQYLGSRGHVTVRYKRNAVHFTKENGRILETFDQDAVDAIVRLSNSYQFRFLVEQPLKQVAEPVKVEEKPDVVEPIKDEEAEKIEPKSKSKGAKNVKK